MADRKGILEFDRSYLSKDAILPVSITKYITKGHEPFDSAVGDINDDNLPDLLLLTSVINEDSVNTNAILTDKYIRFDSIPMKRQLLLFTGEKDGSFTFRCRNWNAIPCRDCCGMTDPYGGIAIKNGTLMITEYCASNCKGITQFHFKYDSAKKNWFLALAIEESYCFNFQDYSLDTLTSKELGRISINKFDINKD